ncbi:hypothetical protein [Desulfospira joergensenii]|uniref:hypothetical protein n=1 Tax=Desulfospira joergensenii TaxID=53329 RepID=UPI0003B6B28C|nr:hypothetical protein [Desulfospira joergensenii]
MKSSYKNWGMIPREHDLAFPCDQCGKNFSDTYFRGITIHAEPKRIFPWLCQMRVAPYSYDWIDNLGRKSPQRLIPGLDRLEIGQKIMFIFDLIDFQQNVHLTLRLDKRLRKVFGDTIITYMIFRQKQDVSRLLVKILVRYPRGIAGILLDKLLPPGDLIMMRRQLINFKGLSEEGSAGTKDKG